MDPPPLIVKPEVGLRDEGIVACDPAEIKPTKNLCLKLRRGANFPDTIALAWRTSRMWYVYGRELSSPALFSFYVNGYRRA